ncbi:MAG: T9SS type A sorting domain-containing protein [Ignavibacteriales bacterium]|nr:T9SS type A sorting domain-containing protein [Ignavibacteriales bacterium]
MIFRQFILSVVLLSVVSVTKGQSTSNDYFPLYIGNQWTYNYLTITDTPSDWIITDNGIAIYTILSKSVSTDSIVWGFQEIRDLIRDSHFTFPPQNHDTSFINDTTLFQIVEYNSGNHKLIRIGNISNFWNSVFPFISGPNDSMGFYRYYPSAFSDFDTVTFISIDTSMSRTVPFRCNIKNATFRKSVGLTNISTSSNEQVLVGHTTNHTLKSFVLTSVNASLLSSLPKDFILSQNYPNPFNPQTIIPFQIAKEARVSIRIYDVLGRLVSTVYDGNIKTGDHAVQWNASNQSAGIYLCVLNVNGVSKAMKMVLLK